VASAKRVLYPHAGVVFAVIKLLREDDIATETTARFVQ
jgi:hypothetical protein